MTIRNKQYYENRINLLSNRNTECQRIIAKLKRRLRQLENK